MQQFGSIAAVHRVPDPSIHGIEGFGQIWAERYSYPADPADPQPNPDKDTRSHIAKTLHHHLRPVSVEVWDRPEILLARQQVRRQMYGRLADPVAISQTVQTLYSQALESYTQGLPADRLAVKLAGAIGAIRAQFTTVDPRVLGFVNMQFHYTGQQLLALVSPPYRAALGIYFQALGDQLYMPLHRAYTAAIAAPDSILALGIFHRCLPLSRPIAQAVCDRVLAAFPNHHCYGGALASEPVRASSIRDVELFQTYLWVCLLEGNFNALRQELFPLCTMVYPILNVRWELVRYMLMLLGHEMGRYLEPAQWKLCRSHLDTFQEICAGDRDAAHLA
ncbi:MAG: hypothetical protein HC812_11240 [Leptolyngbya sp. RL_3_1]|nr:hypothetical protein [Leptolyngbya sp. RL_3_1]